MEAMLGRIVQKLVRHISEEMLGVLWDLLEKLSGSHNKELWLVNLKKFLRGELVARWRKGDDGVIYFSVPSYSMSGSKWLRRFQGLGFIINIITQGILRSRSFQSSSAGTYEIAVFSGSLFEDGDRSISKIRLRAAHRHFLIPNADLACLIRDNFSNKEIRAMGLKRIIVMHQPIDGYMLMFGCDGAGLWLDKCDDRLGDDWGREEEGFAFVVFFNSEND